MINRSLFAPLALVALVGCSKEPPAPVSETVPASAKETPKPAADPHAAFARVEVEEMAQLIKDSKAVPVDANGDDTRKELGVLPGAVRLTSAKAFEATELPKDKGSSLVFYCGGEACTAAPKAAQRAQELGYANVKVMGAGIRGWVKAGHPVEKTEG